MVVDVVSQVHVLLNKMEILIFLTSTSVALLPFSLGDWKGVGMKSVTIPFIKKISDQRLFSRFCNFLISTETAVFMNLSFHERAFLNVK